MIVWINVVIVDNYYYYYYYYLLFYHLFVFLLGINTNTHSTSITSTTSHNYNLFTKTTIIYHDINHAQFQATPPKHRLTSFFTPIRSQYSSTFFVPLLSRDLVAFSRLLQHCHAVLQLKFLLKLPFHKFNAVFAGFKLMTFMIFMMSMAR